MSDESLINDFADSYGDLDADLAQTYKEAMNATEDEAVERMRTRLENILEERLQAQEQK